MDIESLTVGPLAANCYVVSAGGDVVVVDPGAEAERILKAVGERRVAAILATHGHSDHVGAVRELAAATAAPVMVPAADVALAEKHTGVQAVTPLGDGDRIDVGNVSLEVVATPGHTPGSSCFYTPGALFTGDTLFAGGVGRTDLQGGSSEALFASIRERIFSLPGDTAVYPGHGEPSTVARERATNPFFTAEGV